MRLRHGLNQAFKFYSTSGKKQLPSKTYGIDWQAIIDHLGPCPGERSEYHIDHIIPLCAFDFDDPEQVKAAFAPENHRWLKAEDNRSKSGRYDPVEVQRYLNQFRDQAA